MSNVHPQQLRQYANILRNWLNGINGAIQREILEQMCVALGDAAKDLELADAMIYDLRQEVNGMRPLTWRTRYTREEVIKIYATAEHPITSIEHELLRRGIYPENKTEISMAYRFLEQGRLVCNGDIMVGSPAYNKLPDPKPEPIKYSDSDY